MERRNRYPLARNQGTDESKPNMRSHYSRAVCCLLSVSALGTVACAVDESIETEEAEAALCNDGPGDHDHDGRGDRGPVFLDQGWDKTTRAAFYQTSQGSRMLPYDWFLHLEQAGSRDLLRAPDHM